LAKTKTASVRLPKEMYEEIDNICDEVGCSRNDWIKDTLQDKLREENSQDQEENNSRPDHNTTQKELKKEPKPKIEITDVKEPKVVEVNFNPKDYEIVKAEPKATIELIPEAKVTIKEVPQDNSNKPVVQFTHFNGNLLPVAKRFNT